MRKLFILLSILTFSIAYASIEPAPKRERGEGPYSQLILRGVNYVAGHGAPMLGPVDIVIENDRIKSIVSIGSPGADIKQSRRPKAESNAKEIDLTGYTVLPGFIDMHGHLGGKQQGTPAEYVLKLWLAHGITTVREPGSFNGLEWTVEQQKRSDKNEIASPRIVPYVGFGKPDGTPFKDAAEVKAWVKSVHKMGARGIKFFGDRPEIIQAAIEQAKKLNMGTTMHHAQLNVVRMNALTSARMGLTSMEHWYGLPEALFENQVVQNYPLDYNYQDEDHRFTEAGNLWLQAAKPYSDKWNAVRDELISLDFTLDPTFTIYEANRDLMREHQAVWHKDYTLPSLWKFFEPDRNAHGSYWFDWTTEKEIAWKQNYARWMMFVNDYKNHGGRVTTGSDSGYIYKLYGFGFIRELELLQEAGFHPLEVLKAATINGAEVLGLANEIGSVEVGKRADLVIVKGNPLANFKLLYGTGHFMLNENNEAIRTPGIRYTIKDGIVFDVNELLADVRAMVVNAKQ